MLIQMSGPRDIIIYRPDPPAFSVVQKPWGLGTHFGAKDLAVVLGGGEGGEGRGGEEGW